MESVVLFKIDFWQHDLFGKYLSLKNKLTIKYELLGGLDKSTAGVEEEGEGGERGGGVHWLLLEVWGGQGGRGREDFDGQKECKQEKTASCGY